MNSVWPHTPEDPEIFFEYLEKIVALFSDMPEVQLKVSEYIEFEKQYEDFFEKLIKVWEIVTHWGFAWDSIDDFEVQHFKDYLKWKRNSKKIKLLEKDIKMFSSWIQPGWNFWRIKRIELFRRLVRLKQLRDILVRKKGKLFYKVIDWGVGSISKHLNKIT